MSKKQSIPKTAFLPLYITNRSLHVGCKVIYPISCKGSLQDGISKVTAVDYLTLILLSLGLSLDDFGLAFALSLLMPSGTFKKLMVNAGKMAVAFSISTALLPLLGWLVGLAIYGWLASFSGWVVLIVFAGVGIWIIKEAFEGEQPKWMMEKVSSFWALSAMGVLGSIDEGAVGVSYPFLEIPVLWIIVAVLLANTVLILFATLLSNG
jgi:putative Mn2+ efflux pump MntP